MSCDCNRHGKCLLVARFSLHDFLNSEFELSGNNSVLWPSMHGHCHFCVTDSIGSVRNAASASVLIFLC